MAETVEATQGAQVVTTESTEAVLTPEQVDIQKQMEYAFMDELPQVVEPTATTDTPATSDTPAPTPAATTDYLKELGYESIEAAKAEIEALRLLKANPPQATKEEIAFANEESKKIHQLLKEGKTKEVKMYLDAQDLICNVDTMADEQKLKLYIKMQNPKFDKELIEDEYAALYTIDEEDDRLLGKDGLVDPMKLRKEKLRMEQRLENDVQKAQEYFSQYAKKVELPDISQPTVEVDDDYEAYKASNATATEKYNNETVPAINSLKESDIQLKANINDANNQMQFDVSVVPEKEDFEKARQDSLSILNYLKKTCYDQSGKFFPDKLTKMILLNNNFDKYAQSIARQAVNAERIRVVEEEKQGGVVRRDFNSPIQKTELEKQMEFALS